MSFGWRVWGRRRWCSVIWRRRIPGRLHDRFHNVIRLWERWVHTNNHNDCQWRAHNQDCPKRRWGRWHGRPCWPLEWDGGRSATAHAAAGSKRQRERGRKGRSTPRTAARPWHGHSSDDGEEEPSPRRRFLRKLEAVLFPAQSGVYPYHVLALCLRARKAIVWDICISGKIR